MAEGWMDEKRWGTRVYHYIFAGRSLCGRYGFYAAGLSPADEAEQKRPDDCAECYRRLQKRKAQRVTA